jgi:predicted flap endonuclease-1-like 5' DNA nuclease
MQYLVVTDWMWFVVALPVGGAVGYWLSWRLVPGDMRHLLAWGAAVVLVGLAAAVLHWLPPRDDLQLGIPLLLAFGGAFGGLLGSWLHDARLRRQLEDAELASNASAERAVLGARAKATVRSDQDASASGKVVEEAPAAEAPAVEPQAELIRAAAAKAAEDERLAAEARAAEAARIAAAKATRIAAAAKAAEERLAAKARAAEAARVADEQRLAAAAKAAEAAQGAAAARTAEDARLAAEAKAVEETRLSAAVKAVQENRLAIEAKAADEVRETAAATPAEEPAVAATTAKADEFHPGSKPQGIAAPAEGEADDLKLVRGIGPRNEKACNALGIYRFRQIADWTPDEAVWVGHHIAFPGRIEREHWIAQARLLASGGETEHSTAVKSGAVVVDDRADQPLDPAAAETVGRSLPEQAAAIDGEDKHPGRRPYGLAAARGKADNLKRIRGIGPQNEGRLHALGIWHFSQMAAWSDENVKWVGSYLAFSGRIHREKWVAQARDLAAGKDTELSRRAPAGKATAAKDDGSLGQGDVPRLK